jgi:cysteine synthase
MHPSAGRCFAGGYLDAPAASNWSNSNFAQGTIGLEMLEQVPDMDAVIVPVGGAGLIAGIALAVKVSGNNWNFFAKTSQRCGLESLSLAIGHFAGPQIEQKSHRECS